jgi:hypothetical protein
VNKLFRCRPFLEVFIERLLLAHRGGAAVAAFVSRRGGIVVAAELSRSGQEADSFAVLTRAQPSIGSARVDFPAGSATRLFASSQR